MPTLIVEDGTGVANANTYIDEAYLLAYAADRGFTAPSTSQVQQEYILVAMDYLSWYTDEFQGSRNDSENALPWPRQNVVIDGADVAVTAIPSQLKNAQSQLVIAQQQQIQLFPTPRTSTVEGLITEKTVGPMTKKFAFTGKGIANANAPIKIMSVEIFLKPLVSCSKTALNTYRV